MNIPPSLVQAQQYLNQLDLGYIITSMCAKTYPLPRWTLPDATDCAQLYKEFLYLNKKYENEELVPTREIDEFWHNHILYTKNYYTDCQQIFGFYLHHEPASPQDDPQNLVDNYLKTKTLYQTEFNRPYGLIVRT